MIATKGGLLGQDEADTDHWVKTKLTQITITRIVLP